MTDELGKRMKEYYESRTRIYLPRRTHTIIRVDGKAFHTYTKGMSRPFDDVFIYGMNETAQYMCENIQGAKLAYVQSDEISILLTDFDKLGTDAWFDGNIQKVASVSASLATAKFNQVMLNDKIGLFDSRVFTIPSIIEVVNYFIWRQKDCVRNSISSTAQSYFSPTELHGKSTSEMQEMLFTKKDINWNDYAPNLKRGRVIIKEEYDAKINLDSDDTVKRTRWIVEPAETFTTNREFITNLVPKPE